MQKSHSFSLDSSINFKLPPSIKNQDQAPIPNPSEISCSKCRTKSLSSLNIQRQNQSNNYNIKIVCKNEHTEEMPLIKFAYLNFHIYKKNCAKCKQKIEIKKINYCNKCKKFFCKNCPCEHSKDSVSISSYYTLLENKCNFHNQNIQEYYCVDCSKNLCKSCLKNHDQSHKNIVNLMEKFNKYEKMIKNEIVKEKILVEKYNKIINALREFIYNDIRQKKMFHELKKSILLSYTSNNMNYYNIQNMDFAKNNLNMEFNEKKMKELIEIFKKH